MTERRYWFEPAQGGEAVVTAIVAGERPALRLDRTWFHPQGGGQKADRGTIDGIAVVHVAPSEGGAIDHFLESVAGFALGQRVRLAIDTDWRQEQTRLHTAGHLVGEVLPRLHPALAAIAGHHWPGEARVDFAVAGESIPPPDELLAALDAALAGAIAADWPVTCRVEAGERRTVTVGEDGQAIGCGGTHLAGVGALGNVVVTEAKRKGDRLRVRYAVAA